MHSIAINGGALFFKDNDMIYIQKSRISYKKI